MPIPIPPSQHNAFYTLCSRVKQLILDTRIGTDCACVCHDDDDDGNDDQQICLLGQRSVYSNSIVINVLQKDSDILLERWILSQDNNLLSTVDSVPAILSSFICKMPLYNLLDDIYVIVSDTSKSQNQCYSYRPKHNHMEFMQDSKLKSQKFHFPPNNLIKVIYDEHIQQYKRPVISLVRTNLPWNIVRTDNNNNNVNNDSTFPLQRRLSRLSISALEEEGRDNNNSVSHQQQRMHSIHPIINTIPRNHHPHLHQNVLYRRNSIDLHPHRLVGSFEESLLSGRMSSMPSKSIIPFHCQIGVLGIGDGCKRSLRCPPHYSTTFPVVYYPLDAEDDLLSTPYVGTVDLLESKYRIPPQGQLQVIIKNPNKIPIKLFLIPYNFKDMPANTKTFLRQKSYTQQQPRVLKYAIHLQVLKSKHNRIYLHKSIRVVFANRKVDAHEKFDVVCEGPNEPTFVPLCK